MPAQVPNPNLLRASLAVLAALLIQACQTTETVDTSDGPQDVSHQFSVLRAQLQPDSASWETTTEKGDAHLTHDTNSINNNYGVSFHLKQGPGKGTLALSLWRAGMLTARPTFDVKNGGLTIIAGNRDSLATAILDKLFDLNLSSPAAFPKDQDSSIAKSMAILIIDRESLFVHWTRDFPKGVDTARVRREALIYAASKGQTLASLTPTWFLGMDLAQAKAAILALVPTHIPASDTEVLFPLPPVRVVEPVSLSSDLYSDSASVALHGSFVAKNRLYPPSLRVLKDGVDAASHFAFEQSASPGSASKKWDLAVDGAVTLRAYGKAPAGTYTLVVTMDDGTFSDSSMCRFEILPKPDRTGPSLSRVSPISDTSLEYKDSVVVLRVRATDTSGVQSVSLDGQILTRQGDEYLISRTLPGNNNWTTFSVKAVDELGNESRISIGVLRKSSETSKSTATLLEPSSKRGDTIPAAQRTRRVTWKITDPVGIVPSTVMIDRTFATKVDDSTWSATVSIPPTGTETAILVQALNTKGNGVVDSVMVVRRKDTKPPVSIALAGARTLLFDSSSAKVAWKISDDVKLDSVWIDAIPQAVRADSVYSTNITLAIGPNQVRLSAKDSAGNKFLDSLIVTRLPNTTPPVLKRLAGTSDLTIAFGTDSVLLRWTASGNEKIDSVSINGRRAINSKDTFQLKVALSAGTVPVVAQAWNLSGLSVKDSLAISVKLRDKDGNYYSIRTMPDGRLWMTQNLKTLPFQGTSACAMSNCEQNGATYTWSQAMGLDPAYDATNFGYVATNAVSGLCPTGWHIPTRTEWSGLLASTLDSTSSDSAYSLKTQSGWAGQQCLILIGSGTSSCMPRNANGSDKFGGFLTPTAGTSTSNYASFWLADEQAALATASTVRYTGSSAFFGQYVTSPAMSKATPSVARCIKDLPRIIIIRPPIDIIKIPVLGL